MRVPNSYNGAGIFAISKLWALNQRFSLSWLVLNDVQYGNRVNQLPKGYGLF
ncbi:MAG: hypothetical protein CLLPBCKN_007137 [Chroococcidiopsis cubana SAG 39.79]|nr:hypothetical protein [Chroococcidiopsis cubana SAG 39.79]